MATKGGIPADDEFNSLCEGLTNRTENLETASTLGMKIDGKEASRLLEAASGRGAEAVVAAEIGGAIYVSSPLEFESLTFVEADSDSCSILILRDGSFKGALIIDDCAEIGGGISVEGGGSFNGTLAIRGGGILRGGLEVGPGGEFSGDVTVSIGGEMHGNLAVHGDFCADVEVSDGGYLKGDTQAFGESQVATSIFMNGNGAVFTGNMWSCPNSVFSCDVHVGHGAIFDGSIRLLSPRESDVSARVENRGQFTGNVAQAEYDVEVQDLAELDWVPIPEAVRQIHQP